MSRFNHHFPTALVLVIAILFFVNSHGSDVIAQPEEFTEEEEGGPEEDWEALEEHEREAEFEWHLRHLEMERLEHEARFRHLETTMRMAEIAQHELATASYAISQIRDLVGDEESVEILQNILDDVREAPLKRLLRIELAQLLGQHDRPDEAVEHLRQLIAVE